MTMLPHSRIHNRSAWWRSQKLCAILLTGGIAVWLGMHIRAATLEVTLNELDLPIIPGTTIRDTPVGLPSGTKQVSNATMLPTYYLTASEEIGLGVSADPVLTSLPKAISDRIHWRVFCLSRGDIWRVLSGTVTQDISARFTHTFSQPGKYLVFVALPPIDLDELDGKTSAHMASFLIGSTRSKYRALQVYLGGTPPPPPPIDTQPAEKGPRDLSAKQEGMNESFGSSKRGDASGQQKKHNEETANVSIPLRAQEQPITVEDVRRLFMEGRLPELDIDFDPKQLLRLEAGEWSLICKTHNIPFVLVPEKDSQRRFPEWPMLLSDGTRTKLPPMQIRKAYGGYQIPLTKFSPMVQQSIQRRLGDHDAWFYRSVQHSGFRLSDILVIAVHRALSEHAIPLSQLNDIEIILLSLDFTDDQPHSRLRILSKRVVRKK